MIHYALFIGRGEGCDYTIGCNRNFTRLRSSTADDAKREALEEYSLDPQIDSPIESIKLLAVAEEHDLGPELREARAAIQDKKRAAEKAKKVAEIERLKRELDR